MTVATPEPAEKSPQSAAITLPRLNHLRLLEAESIHILREVASEFSTEEIDATELTGTSAVRQLERKHFGRAIGGRGHAVIINEAHQLRKDVIAALLTALERIPEYVVWVFTTTKDGKESLFDEQIDSHPLLSRCVELALAQRDLARPFAERARQIAQQEGLDGKPVEAYLRLMQDCRNNFRQALNRIEKGEMLG